MSFSGDIIDELVGIVGMLDNGEGSTVNNIVSVMESLHGPVRVDVIVEGLKEATSSGLLDCRNRRYKIRKQNVSQTDSFFDVAGCSSWEVSPPGVSDLSISSLNAQVYQYLGREPQCSPSEESIDDTLSGKSQSFGELSSRSDVRDLKSDNSLIDSKIKKNDGKVEMCPTGTLPRHENDAERANDKLQESVKEVIKNMQTNGSFPNDTEGKDGRENLPAKVSVSDIMNEVMKQFSQPKNTNVCVEIDKGLSSTEANGKKLPNNMSKVMTEIMKKVKTFEKSESITESSKKESQEVESVVKSLGGAITDVMKRFTGGNIQQRTSHEKLDNNDKCNDESYFKAGKRSLVTESQGILPCSSDTQSNKSAKRGKKSRQECDTPPRLYFTRSKSNELRRSHLQSPSDASVSSKRVKLS